MIRDEIAHAWAILLEDGVLTRDANPDIWDAVQVEDGLDDLQKHADYLDLEIIPTTGELWLTAQPGSRYEQSVSSTMRSLSPSYEKTWLVVYASLIILAEFNPDNNLAGIEFIDEETAMRYVDDSVQRNKDNDQLSDEARNAVATWRGLPDGIEDMDMQKRGNDRNRRGLILYALRYLSNENWIEQAADGVWRPTKRMRCLWNEAMSTENFKARAQKLGIDVGERG